MQQHNMAGSRVGSFVIFLLYLLHGTAFYFRYPTLKVCVHKHSNLFLRSPTRWMQPQNQKDGDQDAHAGGTLFDSVRSKLKTDSKELQVIISGAPAAGKGTQCEFIQAKFGIVHISTGELLRTAMRENSDLGNSVRVYMDAGKLVPDNIIISVVCARLSQPDCQERGWLLDGFPRTKAQAEALYRDGHVADCFVLLDVSQDILLDRITGRRTDPLTGKVYHLTHNPPGDPEVAQRMVQRSDDTAEKLLGRYADYYRNTEAIRSFYDDRTIVVDGGASKDSISKHLHEVLTVVKNKKMDGSEVAHDQIVQDMFMSYGNL